MVNPRKLYLTNFGRSRVAGFTLLELLVVVAVIGILTVIVLPQLRPVPQRAREAVLRTNLHTIRDVLDQYFADKQRCADSLQTLVDDGYLRGIPIDPFTGSTDTWVVEYCEGEDAALGALQGLEDSFGGPGIWDIHSGAAEYSDW